MLLPILFIVLGLILLVGGGEGTVRGASALAQKLKVDPYVIGATIVAFGTSAPELVVTLTASYKGSGELALGNIVGSNIANIALILGIAALLRKVELPRKILHTETIPFIIVAVALIAFAWDGHIGFVSGIILLLTGGAIGAALLYMNRRSKDSPLVDAPDIPAMSPLLAAVMLAAGLGGLVGGAQLLVEGGVQIAQAFHVPEWVIGVGVLAVGTSLPEVAASVTAAVRGRGELAIGNVVGSNAFNVLWVLGIGGYLHPVVAQESITFDLMVYGGLSVFLLGTLYLRGALEQWSGALLFLSYIAYMVLRFSGAV